MLKIIYLNNEVIEKLSISDSYNEELELTELEIAIRNTKDIELGNSIFFESESTFPTCELKYIARKNNEFSEMNEAEKKIVDKKIFRADWKYPEKKYRVTVQKDLCKSGQVLERLAFDMWIDNAPYYYSDDNEYIIVYLSFINENDLLLLQNTNSKVEEY